MLAGITYAASLSTNPRFRSYTVTAPAPVLATEDLALPRRLILPPAAPARRARLRSTWNMRVVGLLTLPPLRPSLQYQSSPNLALLVAAAARPPDLVPDTLFPPACSLTLLPIVRSPLLTQVRALLRVLAP